MSSLYINGVDYSFVRDKRVSCIISDYDRFSAGEQSDGEWYIFSPKSCRSQCCGGRCELCRQVSLHAIWRRKALTALINKDLADYMPRFIEEFEILRTQDVHKFSLPGGSIELVERNMVKRRELLWSELLGTPPPPSDGIGTQAGPIIGESSDEEPDGFLDDDSSAFRFDSIPSASSAEPETPLPRASALPPILLHVLADSEVTAAIANMGEHGRKILREVESFGILAGILYKCTTWTEYVQALYTFLQWKYGISVLDAAYVWIGKLVESSRPQDISVQDGSFCDILRGVALDSQKVKHSDFMSRFRKIGALISTLCVCTSLGVTATPSKFAEVWTGLATQASSLDMVSQILEAMVWIYDKCVPVLMGKAKPSSVFTDVQLARKIDIRYAALKVQYNAVESEGAAFDVSACELAVHELCQMEEDIIIIMGKLAPKAERNIWTHQLAHVKTLIAGFQRILNGSALRQAPFALAVSGDSATGKSCATALMAPLLQRASGVLEGPNYVYNFDPAEKYMSSLTPAANLFVMDDLANTKALFVEQAPSNAIVEIINNNQRFARMADVGAKGKMPIRPAVVIATTNVDHLDSSVYTNCPLSVMRRFKAHVHIRVKEEFCGAGTNMLDPSIRPQDHNYDVWVVTVREAINGDSSSASSKDFAWRILEDASGPLSEVSMVRALRYITAAARAHAEQQKTLVREANVLHLREVCAHGVFAGMCDLCDVIVQAEPVAVQSGDYNPESLLANVGFWARCTEYKFGTYCRLYKWIRWGIGAALYVPRNHRRWRALFGAARAIHQAEPSRWAMGSLATALVAGSCCLGSGITKTFVGTVSFMILLQLACIATCAYCFVGRHMYGIPAGVKVEAFGPEFGTLEAATRRAKEELYQARYGIVVGTTAILGLVLVVYKLVYKKISAQGSTLVIPKPESGQKSKDPWRVAHVVRAPRNMDRITSTGTQMAEVLSDKICILTMYTQEGSGSRALCWPVKTNFWIAPLHILEKDYKWISIQCDGTDRLHYRHKLRREGSYARIGKSDLAIVYVPGKGDQQDLTFMFPSQSELTHARVQLKNAACKLVWAKLETKVVDDRTWLGLDRTITGVNVNSQMVNPEGIDFAYWGGRYTFPQKTFDGLCGAPLVTEGPGPHVIGMHSAGRTGDSEARYCSVTREEVFAAIEYMVRPDSAMVRGAETTDWSEALNFQSMAFSGEKIRNSQFDWVEGDLALLGSHSGQQRTLRSDVVVTPISDLVEREFGVQRKHGPPMYIGHWLPWQLFLKAASAPAEVPQVYLDRAYKDYSTKIHAALNEHPEWKDYISPLADDANLAGADGVRGCYAVNRNSSMGIPWCKPKKDFISVADREVEGISRPLDMPPEIAVLIQQQEDKLAEGKRIYTPHRANLKDEAIKLGKEKVRVFSGTSFPYLFLIRRYFLPILMFMHNRSELFETAVGVNHVSTEWDQLREIVTKYGNDRMISGDYAEYDKRMSAAFVLAAFKLLISIAKWAGYSDRQLRVMESLATETGSPIYELMKEWGRMPGSNPAGHGATVDINGIVNALYWRCSDQANRPEGEMRMFHEMVSLITYGDDSVGGVVEDAPWINHTTMQNTFAEWGIGFTMADKVSVSVPYTGIDDVDFLKRKWVWSDEHQRFMAPLEEASIFKMLHTVTRSKSISIEQQVAECLLAANREFFQHGLEKFTTSRKKLSRIAEEQGVSHYFSNCRLHSYDELVEWMRDSE